uniref:Uncharacterized protein n=1 Tax=Parascaris equorum TaxID=6256 RepID=A0A914R098_PAREQ
MSEAEYLPGLTSLPWLGAFGASKGGGGGAAPTPGNGGGAGGGPPGNTGAEITQALKMISIYATERCS